jgi:PAS domain S-box-containing protein
MGGVCTDITQFKAAEDRLKAEQKRLDAVLHNLDVGIITSDASGQITMFNRKAAELTGQSSASVKGKHFDDIYQVRDAGTGSAVRQNPGDNYGNPDQPVLQAVVLDTEDGRTRELLQKTIPLLDGFGQHTGILLILSEINSTIKQDTPPGEAQVGTLGNGTESNRENLSGGLVLVMDDDRLVRKTTTLMLERGGYQVVTAKNGEEAIRIYLDHMATDQPIIAIIMDLTVPGAMGGVEATRQILALDSDARIMVASGYSNDPILANYLAHGFLARVEKPFELDELLVTIRNILQ